MMRVLLAALCISLTGCAGGPLMVNSYEVRGAFIQWDRVAPTTCGGQIETRGCAQWSTPRTKDINTCIITARADSPDDILGHEFRHCFGYDHALRGIK